MALRPLWEHDMSNVQLIAPPPDVTLAELIAEEKRAWE